MRFLTLIKLDATRLFERLAGRRVEYLNLFALKRTREPFDAVFASKFDQVQLSELGQCSEELIVAIDQFYAEVEQLKWYLYHTEDMPGTIDDELNRALKRIGRYFEDLMLMLKVEIDLAKESAYSDD